MGIMNGLFGWKALAYGMLMAMAAVPRAEAGWSSSGGEIVLDSRNPWFVKGVGSVNACLEIDERHFGLPAEKARQRIEEAWEFWRDQYRESILSESIGVGRQVLQWVPSCQGNVDIAFQLGSLKLDQVARMPDASRMIAVSVRTDYDRGTLRGRGFVYLSPQTGPLALRAAGLVEDRWSLEDGALARLVLIHELGHIFGLNHEGGTKFENSFEVMNERFPQTVTSSYWAKDVAAGLRSPSSVREWLRPFGEKNVSCGTSASHGMSPALRAFWGLSAGARALEIEVRRGYLRVFESDSMIPDTGDTPGLRLVGSAKLRAFVTEQTSIASIFLPAEQRIFSQPDPRSNPFRELPTALSKRSMYTANYLPLEGGRERVLEVDLRGSEARLTGLFDGVLAGDLLCDVKEHDTADSERTVHTSARERFQPRSRPARPPFLRK